MTLGEVKDWLGVMSAGGVLLSFVLLNWLRGQFLPKGDADGLRGALREQGQKIEALEDRVSKIEGEIDHLPDKDVTHRLEMAIARLDGKFELLDERLKPVASVMSRMQDYLMDDKR